MKDVMLPLPSGGLKLFTTLALVEALEVDRSLLKTAERLISRDLKVTEALDILRACYRHAGYALDDSALDAFLLEQTPSLLLAEVLVAILAPLAAMGALKKDAELGEMQPAPRIFAI